MCLKVVNPVDAESNHLQPKTAFSRRGIPFQTDRDDHQKYTIDPSTFLFNFW